MLYYLFEYLDQLNFPGSGAFQFISFRAAIAMLISLIITVVFGGRMIDRLRNLQVADKIRDLGLIGEKQKQGTPTMGGLIILLAILLPTILLAKLDNIYIILMLVTTIWMGAIGFIDDYIKVFKKDKGGLRGRSKIIGQIGLGLIVGSVMYFHPDVVVREDVSTHQEKTFYQEIERKQVKTDGEDRLVVDYRATTTSIPFVKTYQFDYSKPLSFLGEGYQNWAFLIYIPFIIFIIIAVSNAANLTDGIDGLATGVSGIIAVCLGVFAYFSGNFILADYLNIMYLPYTGELVVFSAAFVGACVGFLWYNAFPAQVFMGDTGSLALGGIIATLAITIRKELLIPILCGIFLLENLSVVMQVSYFKYTRKKYGEGKRIFLMSPLHHHYQKKGIHEAKIVTRFWIVGIFLALITFVIFKLN
ncbi:MAG: phospho-N-acetylmuramoyl-pentapeptide-transferase [Chitinophagales bacterium]